VRFGTERAFLIATRKRYVVPLLRPVISAVAIPLAIVGAVVQELHVIPAVE
jgi:hypothetical protein